MDVVAIRTVLAQGPFIEQALDAAIHADAVGMSLEPDRPSHPFVAATAEGQHPDSIEEGAHIISPSGQCQPCPLAGILITKVMHMYHVDSR